MLKLYKIIDGVWYYWETWDQDENTGIVHWGKVGQNGETEYYQSTAFSNFHDRIQEIVNRKISDGYSELEDYDSLEIEYNVSGFGSEADLEKRHRLEEKLNEVLGWKGLGHVDGGSMGSGTMEVGCEVVNFELAKQVVASELKGTEFENYTRIFSLDEE